MRMKRSHCIRTHEIFVRKPPRTKYTKIKKRTKYSGFTGSIFLSVVSLLRWIRLRFVIVPVPTMLEPLTECMFMGCVFGLSVRYLFQVCFLTTFLVHLLLWFVADFVLFHQIGVSRKKELFVQFPVKVCCFNGKWLVWTLLVEFAICLFHLVAFLSVASSWKCTGVFFFLKMCMILHFSQSSSCMADVYLSRHQRVHNRFECSDGGGGGGGITIQLWQGSREESVWWGNSIRPLLLMETVEEDCHSHSHLNFLNCSFSCFRGDLSSCIDWSILCFRGFAASWWHCRSTCMAYLTDMSCGAAIASSYSSMGKASVSTAVSVRYLMSHLRFSSYSKTSTFILL